MGTPRTALLRQAVTWLGLLALAGPAAPATPAGAEAALACADCPAMVSMAPGRLRMGSPDGEAGRADDGREGPVREVRIGRPFALARHEVTVGEFKRFVADTGYLSSAEQPGAEPGCTGWLVEEKTFVRRASLNWRAPGFAQTDQHPVVCVSWLDAQAYVRWLARRSGLPFRLPSEAEWEYAARAGAMDSSRYWGDDPSLACRHANVADETAGPGDYRWRDRHACADGHFNTAPVGSYAANAYGFQDLLGNAWEWVQDCYDKQAYAGAAPTDGSALETAGCAARAMRGGSWYSGPSRARSAYRGGYAPDSRFNVYGFRVARSLE